MCYLFAGFDNGYRGQKFVLIGGYQRNAEFTVNEI